MALVTTPLLKIQNICLKLAEINELPSCVYLVISYGEHKQITSNLKLQTN